MRLPIDIERWREYLTEAAALGFFMISAACFSVLLDHPDSAAQTLVPSAVVRRLLMGVAMGATAMAIIYSPWGVKSGAHMNPAVTLAFLRLRRIAPRDAVPYMLMHFLGAMAGVGIAALTLQPFVAHPAVSYVAARPGPLGAGAAFAAELLTSFLMMAVILLVSRSRRASATGLAAGTLLAVAIFLEAPISGVSLNPARSLAPAMFSGNFSDLWIYFTAPVLGMALAGEGYRRWVSGRGVARRVPALQA